MKGFNNFIIRNVLKLEADTQSLIKTKNVQAFSSKLDEVRGKETIQHGQMGMPVFHLQAIIQFLEELKTTIFI